MTTTIPKNQFTAPVSNYPVKQELGALSEHDLKLQFIENTSLSSIIENHGIYSSSGYVEWKKSPLNSLTFLIAEELGFESSAIVHWELGSDERGQISIDHTKKNIRRFNEALGYQSYAFRWPNSGITECLFRHDQNLPAPLHEILGLKFQEGKKVGKGKKRMHIFGLSQGAFLYARPSYNRTIHLAEGVEISWDLEQNVPNDTNDGGGSITRSALIKFLENSNIPHDDKSVAKIDAVQLVIITAEHIIKGIFVVVEDDELHCELLVPEPSLVTELTSNTYTMGKVNLINRKKHKNWVTMEPLQVVPNFLNFTDHNEVATEIYRSSLQAELDSYGDIIKGKPLIDHYDQLQEEKTILPFAYQLDELHLLDTEDDQLMRKFVRACSKASGNSPYANTVLMEQSLSGTYRHHQKLLKHWKGLPGIITSGGRHYITYAPHAAEPDPPEGYIGFILWKDKCNTCGSKTCRNHFVREIRRISINPNDCDARCRDLLDGFDMDDSCFWALLQKDGQVYAWVGRNPMSPDRGLMLKVQDADVEYLKQLGYVILTQVGEWKIPDLWQIPETLKLGDLEDIPQWTWDDDQDLTTCFTLSSKTGGLGQLAMYTSAFQYTGQWDVERHHILNSNVVDAQVNADADIEPAVQKMHKDFVDTFVERKCLMSKYIAQRMDKMLAATGINPDVFVYGESPRLDALDSSLQITDTDLGERDEIRKLLSNGTPAWLVVQLNDDIVELVLRVAKQIRHLWTQHFALVHQCDSALAQDELNEDHYEQIISKNRKEISALIKSLIIDNYQIACGLPNYTVGDFAAAWMQIQATKATRFRMFEEAKFSRPISATPLIYLPEQEIVTCFYNKFTPPTWISRQISNENLIPGAVYSVEQDQTGLIYITDGQNNIAATLLPESQLIVGTQVQYIGAIPRHHDWVQGSTDNWDAQEECGVYYVNHSVWTQHTTRTA